MARTPVRYGRTMIKGDMARPVSMHIGSRFGRLTVVSRAPDKVPRQTRWNCVCDCGNTTVCYAAHLKTGTTVSCGCYQREQSSLRNSGHKMTGDIAYRSWIQMRARCNNPKATSYSIYGGRGIKVCERWDSFELFLADMGPRPSRQHSIDRIDPNKGYEPSNCRWATRIEQQNNHRRTVFIEYNGERLSCAEWSRRTGIKGNVINGRLKLGWPPDKILGFA
jgi:hypothetical protein